jgi:hypothetical protein
MQVYQDSENGYDYGIVSLLDSYLEKSNTHGVNEKESLKGLSG